MNEDRAITVRESHDIDVQRDPIRVLETATRAAKALQDVVSKKLHPVIINKEQYLEFEDLQLLGQFYGYTVRTFDAEAVEINGVQGAKARADLVDFRTGEVVGGAMAYCMADEDRWAGRPWFQLASMAQTRAGAKAFRNRLAWVAVLAGYKATPAEEMTGNEQGAEKQHWCPVHNVAFRQQSKDGRTWYSHKTSDGKYCNERDVIEHQAPKEPAPQAAPKAEPVKQQSNNSAAPTNGDLVIPEFPDAAELMKWAMRTFKVSTKDILGVLGVDNPNVITQFEPAARILAGAFKPVEIV